MSIDDRIAKIEAEQRDRTHNRTPEQRRKVFIAAMGYDPDPDLLAKYDAGTLRREDLFDERECALLAMRDRMLAGEITSAEFYEFKRNQQSG